MATEYTRKQKQTINDAWSLLEYITDSRNWSDGWKRKEALKVEKRQRSNLHSAKALCLQTFQEGFQNPNIPASDVYSYSDGCATMLLMGASYAADCARDRERYGDERPTSGFTPIHLRHDWERLMERITEALAAHDAAINKALAKLRSE